MTWAYKKGGYGEKCIKENEKMLISGIGRVNSSKQRTLLRGGEGEGVRRVGENPNKMQQVLKACLFSFFI